MSIRQATVDDASAIANVHILSWQKTYDHVIPGEVLQNLSFTQRKKEWEELITQEIKLFVLEINAAIIGFASIGPFRDQFAIAHQGEITSIYLHPDNWRKGYGKKLIHFAKKELKMMGFTEILLWVQNDNFRAIQFYEAQGFKSTGIHSQEEWLEGIFLQETLYKKEL